MTNLPAVTLILEELERATQKFGPLSSPHEAIAVIREEYLELEREIFHGTLEKALVEAAQLGAMAARFIVDCGPRHWGYVDDDGSEVEQLGVRHNGEVCVDVQEEVDRLRIQVSKECLCDESKPHGKSLCPIHATEECVTLIADLEHCRTLLARQRKRE